MSVVTKPSDLIKHFWTAATSALMKHEMPGKAGFCFTKKVFSEYMKCPHLPQLFFFTWHNLATRGPRWPQWRVFSSIWLFHHWQSTDGGCRVDFTVLLLCRLWWKFNVHILYLGPDQGVKPLDCFIVRYEAVHPVHIQHYLTEGWRDGKGKGDKARDVVWLIICQFSCVFSSLSWL